MQIDGFERERCSETTRRILCHIASGGLDRPIERLEADWTEVFLAICRNGLLGLTYAYITRHRDGSNLPPELHRQVRAAHARNTLRLAWMYRKVLRLLAQLSTEPIEFMVVKGPAVAHTVYPDPMLRSFSDLDLVIRERDWSAMHRCLLALGFKPELDLPHPPPKVIGQAVPYELKYWHPTEGLAVEVHYDDILNAGLAARDVEGFWARSTTIDVKGVPVRVMSLEDQLVHFCAHAHFHGYTRLNWLSDISLIVRDNAHRLDWMQVVRTVLTEEAEVPVYYSLRLLHQLLGVSAPAWVMAEVQPDRVRRWLHERYMPEEKVRSLQPMPRPDFSFYFIPLFKQMLPDLLVMGRRREKLRYLARLLAPPSAWLRYHYGLKSDEALSLHYILHPLKLTYHYSAAIASAGRRLWQEKSGRQTDGPFAWWAEESPANRARYLAAGEAR